MPPPRQDRGFVLLEALIAAFVLALGLMGLAALQITGAKGQYSAEKHSQAGLLAEDMLERLRANRTAARAGRYDTGLDARPRRCERTACPATPSESRDLCQWKQRLGCSLPAGDGAIGRSGTLVTVTVRWDDSRGSSGNAHRQLVYATGL
ncbi:MAG: type IV pilus modification protein PilV [Candidatus Thiosymbion ectosymbiont of Robbea hypermnestra]|nr:type IV pilus modification protein PilV [Candidatus Thiosymbion ectosymbiont of Robbea hypermnestra]